MQAQLISKINITTGQDNESGMIPTEFLFRCAMPDDRSIDELIDWIDAYFHDRNQ